MININKHAEYFDPIQVTDSVHIIGCGAIGSHVAEMLARLGIENIHLYDFDKVEAHNLANQMYFTTDIGKNKIHSLLSTLLMINSDLQETCVLHSKGWLEDMRPLRGYVFMCVDSVKIRRAILQTNQYSNQVKAFFDFRMRLSDAQHYAVEGSSEGVERMLKSLDFTEEEALAATPISACGTTLSILPTVRMITAVGVANFINFVKGEPLKKMILIDAFAFTTDAM